MPHLQTGGSSDLMRKVGVGAFPKEALQVIMRQREQEIMSKYNHGLLHLCTTNSHRELWFSLWQTRDAKNTFSMKQLHFSYNCVPNETTIVHGLPAVYSVTTWFMLNTIRLAYLYIRNSSCCPSPWTESHVWHQAAEMYVLLFSMSNIS